ncbi:MAG: hypothetical protein ABEJ40_12370 [Haloarculaceae archaeon]
MAETNRRAFCGAVGTAVLTGFTGCSTLGSKDPPAGSLRFANSDDVPHVISVRVTGVGAEPGDSPGAVTGEVIVPPAQRTLSASASVGPNEQHTYRSVFTEPVWYGIRFTFDDRRPENDTGITRFHPSPPDSTTGRYLTGRVSESGKFTWSISGTDNTGTFGE